MTQLTQFQLDILTQIGSGPAPSVAIVKTDEIEKELNGLLQAGLIIDLSYLSSAQGVAIVSLSEHGLKICSAASKQVH